MDILKKNYFDLFGIEEGIDINISSLNKKYNHLQQQFHPDKYANSSSHEKRLALQISSYVNDAYITLGDLVKRIEYILKINNFNKDESETIKDSDFLLEQIQYNEFIDNLQSKNQEEIRSYKNDISKKIHLVIGITKQSYKDNDFANLWNHLSKLRFYIKHVNELTNLENNQ